MKFTFPAIKTCLPALLVFLLVGSLPAFATEDFAAETGQQCSVCHISASGGGGLTATGQSYSEDPESWAPPTTPAKGSSLHLRLAHAVILYAHVFFGIIWVGTILYVHLVLKPKYALGGLPRSELRLAWISMPLIALSGIALTLWRMRLAPGLFSTLFGKLLILKMGVFGAMLASATFVTLYVGPRLRSLAAAHHGKAPEGSDQGRFTVVELEAYDGSEGKVLVAVSGKVYDVTASPMWKGGVHARRHRAGQDLTEFLKDAPHDPDVLERYEVVGELVEESAGRVAPVVRIFTINAYFNLIGCFVIILILVLWRW